MKKLSSLLLMFVLSVSLLQLIPVSTAVTIFFSIECDISNNATPPGNPPLIPTILLSGGSISPNFAICDGKQYQFGATQGAIITATEPADQPSFRYRFASSPGLASTTFVFPAPIIPSSPPILVQFIAEYMQTLNTYAVAPQAPVTWDGVFSIPIKGTFVGTPLTICTIMTALGGGTASCAAWSDVGGTTQFLTSIADGANTNWNAQGGITTVTIKNFPQMFTGHFWLQNTNTYGANPINPTTWDAGYGVPVIGTMFGASVTVCTIPVSLNGGKNTCIGTADWNTVASLPASFASTAPGVNGIWTATAPFFWQDTTGANTHTANYTLTIISSAVSTISIIGNLTPDSTHFSNSLLVTFFPLSGLSLFVVMGRMFKLKGDSGVYIGLSGLTLGSLAGDLSTSATPTLGIPFATTLICAVLIFLYWWQN